MTVREEAAAQVAALAARTRPYLIGVRHHSPALALAVPRLLDAVAADVVCVELPADFQPWLPYVSDPRTIAPVALTGAHQDGRLHFYPLADFSPELAAIRWARQRGAEVICCDLPLADPGWSAGPAATGPDGDDLWDRTVEAQAPGSTPEAVRRAALGVGWALRRGAQARGGTGAVDLAREAHMRRAVAAAGGRRVAAVVGAFHAPGLIGEEEPPAAGTGALPATGPGSSVVTSLVPYAFALLDPRSGYPAGIRDPRWQQAVFDAGGDPGRVRDAAARVITELCREIRAAGHTAGTGEAIETLRLACDLGTLRGLPAPGRSELLEAMTSVLGQGEPLGPVAETVLVGTGRGRTAPGTPRCGLGPWVEAELASLRLPGPGSPARREIRLSPLRSALDARREILLQRLKECGAGYAEPLQVSAAGDGNALTTRWRAAWTPAVAARLELVGVRGVTAAQAADGTLRENHRRASAAGGATPARVIDLLGAAARCALPELVGDCLTQAARILPSAAALPELLTALDVSESIRREHLPGTTERVRVRAAGLSDTLVEAAVRALPGLAGSDEEEDAAALVTLAVRSAEDRLGLRLDGELHHLSRAGSPLVQGAALAARVLLGLDSSELLGGRLADWVDTATGPDTRHRLERRLTGLLIAAGPLIESVPSALDPLLERVETMDDRSFLDRLPALRGGFRALTPAGRGRLLAAVTDRLGDRPGLRLTAPAALVGRWAEADDEGLAVLRELGLAGSLAGAAAPVQPSGAGAGPPTPTEGPVPDGPASAPSEPVACGGPARGTPRLGPADRWRLLLGRDTESLQPDLWPYARALDELFGQSGEGSAQGGEESADDTVRGDGEAYPAEGRGEDEHTGGQGQGYPSARHWAEELQALFGADIREEVLGRAAANGRTDVIAHLDPASVRPSVELLCAVLTLARGMPEQRVASLRPLVKRLIEELTRELATRMRPTLTGLSTPRPTRRPGGGLDLPRTLRANLAHIRRREDGGVEIVPERPVFRTRTARESDWRLILVVDVSASMETSVVWSALTAAVLAGAPMLSTHFLTFSTQVVDLTDRVDDPLSLLLEVKIGGGTHVAAGLAHARSLVKVPNRTLMVVVSDFEEGCALDGLLAETRALLSSGVQLLGCAALGDGGVPRYSVPIARQLVAAGMPVAALSPLSLARWVGERLRGATR
ncbi:hypothetical protein GCM10010377_00710 [Streptomyces viridiviolaceus]|uniref:DUF5682 family protein n=1 Tax=Streptomyces viridiviolaceus TaxID=68282 RepID=A0ABW2DX58_9ACTN|nr:DUF5682 family protein [Streptomyces viridiviolaceus]GHB15375.1 hypothetical protein GCM10010377_00710 [Streptomyces viridiviolaceus]